jgi:hypothetical protein
MCSKFDTSGASWYSKHLLYPLDALLELSIHMSIVHGDRTSLLRWEQIELMKKQSAIDAYLRLAEKHNAMGEPS